LLVKNEKDIFLVLVLVVCKKERITPSIPNGFNDVRT
jgi:hypothetical protein